MEQQKRVYDYMLQHGSITSLEAIQHLGITRLASVIHILKKKNYISSTMVIRRNRYGENCRVAEYKFVAAGDSAPLKPAYQGEEPITITPKPVAKEQQIGLPGFTTTRRPE